MAPMFSLGWGEPEVVIQLTRDKLVGVEEVGGRGGVKEANVVGVGRGAIQPYVNLVDHP